MLIVLYKRVCNHFFLRWVKPLHGEGKMNQPFYFMDKNVLPLIKSLLVLKLKLVIHNRYKICKHSTPYHNDALLLLYLVAVLLLWVDWAEMKTHFSSIKYQTILLKWKNITEPFIEICMIYCNNLLIPRIYIYSKLKGQRYIHFHIIDKEGLLSKTEVKSEE